MRSPLALLALLATLAACSSDPPRCGEGGTSCADAGAPLDRPGVDDVTPVDLGVDAGADLGAALIDDPPASRDLPELVDVQPDVQTGDAGADVGLDVPRDVPGVDVAVDVQTVDVGADAGALDSGTDAGDAVDVQPADVQPVDVASDRADAVDVVGVPRDAGPVDGGPVMYDLEAARTSLDVRALMRGTYASGSMRDCTDVASPSCSVASGVLTFSMNVCFGVSLTGRLTVAGGDAPSLSIFAGGGGSFATSLRFASGGRVGGRRSFHVQFSAPVFQGEPGFRGIPGRTTDPAMADLWLLGCPSD